MPYNSVADGFHTNKLSSRPSSREVQFLDGKRQFGVFEPPFGGLQATYAVHLRSTEKHVVGLLVISELFSLRVMPAALVADTD